MKLGFRFQQYIEIKDMIFHGLLRYPQSCHSENGNILFYPVFQVKMLLA